MTKENSSELENIKNRLLDAIRLSGQLSLERRAPKTASVVALQDIKSGLSNYLKKDPQNGAAWRMLSQTEEILMNFDQAIACLQRAIALSGSPNKKDQKKLIHLKEQETQWQRFPLDPIQLKRLGEFLTWKLGDNTGNRDFTYSTQWLINEGIENYNLVLDAFRDRGAYSDFQVLHNIVRG